MNKYSNAILTVLNVGTMLLFWCVFVDPVVKPRSNMFSSDEFLGTYLVAQANHYSLLQVFLVVVSIFIALVAFWGYNQIKIGAKKKAKQIVKNDLPDLFAKYMNGPGKQEMHRILVEEKMTLQQSSHAQEEQLTEVTTETLENDNA